MIIFVTANLLAFPPQLLQLLQAEGIPVIQKPFQLDTILEAIAHAFVHLQAAAGEHEMPAH